ncbi:MAG: hypothetical protein U1E76_16235 [Planctomycetota bacterium]
MSATRGQAWIGALLVSLGGAGCVSEPEVPVCAPAAAAPAGEQDRSGGGAPRAAGAAWIIERWQHRARAVPAGPAATASAELPRE